jgi:hypothetical protein
VKAIVTMSLIAVLLVGRGDGSTGSNLPPATTLAPSPTGITVTCMSPVQSLVMDKGSAAVTPPGTSQTVTWTFALASRVWSQLWTHAEQTIFFCVT